MERLTKPYHPYDDPSNIDSGAPRFDDRPAMPPVASVWSWDHLQPPGFNPYLTTQYWERPEFPAHISSTSSSPRGMPGSIPKVPIPRTQSLSSRSERRRSARACESCRQRKIKCDGNKPICRQCLEHDLRCTYLDVKRVRDQKQLGLLARKVESYEKLLREVESEVEPCTARKVRKALKASGPRSSTDETSSNMEDDSESIGSLDNIDMIDEDMNRSEMTIATGHFGKNSEISWMQRLEDEAERLSRQSSESVEDATQSSGQQSRHKQVFSISTLSYHLDDLSIPFLHWVDPYALPPKELADQFFEAYMESVHPVFMVIRRSTFASQCQQFFKQPLRPPRRWLAILNLIFAIGCRHLRFVNGTNDSDMDDWVYLNRARKLSLSGNVLFEHADLQQVQVEFLAALYLLSVDQVNRAFTMSSLAFRSALALGINLRFADDRTQNASKEARSRLWWSIYLFEYLLTSITGRVSCVGDSLTAAPLPVPYEEEYFTRPEALCLLQDTPLRASRLKMTLLQSEDEIQSSAEWLATCPTSPSLFFYCLADLTTITQAVASKVYSIRGLRDRASQVEQRIRNYTVTLESWRFKIPEAYRFTEPHSDRPAIPENGPFLRERVYLAFFFYSAKISLCRPCLSHSTTKPDDPSEQLSHRGRFRAEMALTCLRSSCSLIAILPDDPGLIWLSQHAPWWAILHFLMQATTALLLGLTFFPKVDDETRSLSPALSVPIMFASTRKAFRWLHAMSHQNQAFRRAFLSCESFIRRIAPRLGLDIGDFPDGSALSPVTVLPGNANFGLWTSGFGPLAA